MAGEKDEGTDKMSEMKKSLSTMERTVASGIKRSALSQANGEYLYYKHDGAKLRRRPTTTYTSIDDILFGNKWEPYTGDTLEPAMFGTRIENPQAKAEPGDQEAGAPEQKPMMKAIVDRLLFKAAPKK